MHLLQHGINQGITFSVPYLYSDLVFGGLPEYVSCADNLDTQGNCTGLKFCINRDSEYYDILAEALKEHHIDLRENLMDIVGGYMDGDGNIIPSISTGTMELILKTFFPKHENTRVFTKGKEAFSKDGATIATRDDDPKWSDFVNAIVLGLFAAEEANIYQSNASFMANAVVLGDELVRAVEAVGNYGEVYARGVKPMAQRANWNFLNNRTTGLLYTLPFGKVYKVGRGPVPGGMLESVAERNLNCGVRLGRPGFAVNINHSDDLEGMDVAFCKAVASAIYKGESGRVNFVAVESEADGYRKLQEKLVDVLAGFEWTLQNDYREESTGTGYTFSQPYFYGPIDNHLRYESRSPWHSESKKGFNVGSPIHLLSSHSLEFDENLCLVTRQDDPQFSSFVNWIVAATFYAEFSVERGLHADPITKTDAEQMPDVNLFGRPYSKMLRNVVWEVGNYAEVYDANVAPFLPRSDRNTINTVAHRGPQLYVPPNFFREQGQA